MKKRALLSTSKANWCLYFVLGLCLLFFFACNTERLVGTYPIDSDISITFFQKGRTYFVSSQKGLIRSDVAKIALFPSSLNRNAKPVMIKYVGRQLGELGYAVVATYFYKFGNNKLVEQATFRVTVNHEGKITIAFNPNYDLEKLF